jgi:hypothetical protein
MDIIDTFLLKDPYEVSEIVRKAMEPRTVQLGPLKIIVLSNSMPPGVLAHLSCGPELTQNVWLTEKLRSEVWERLDSRSLSGSTKASRRRPSS